MQAIKVSDKRRAVRAACMASGNAMRKMVEPTTWAFDNGRLTAGTGDTAADKDPPLELIGGASKSATVRVMAGATSEMESIQILASAWRQGRPDISMMALPLTRKLARLTRPLRTISSVRIRQK